MDYLDLRAYKEQVYVEAIKDGEIIRVTEAAAIEDDLFILRRLGSQPQTSLQAPVKREIPARGAPILSEWKHGKFGVKKNNVIQDLVPNFHWEISKNRKKQNLTRAKLAQMTGSNENDIKLLELGETPADDFVLISRIEQLFGINLRKYAASTASVNLADLQKRSEQRKKEISQKTSSASQDSASFAGSDIELVDE